MIENVPKEVASKGRVYTSEDDRSRLSLLGEPYGSGTPVSVGIISVDRDPDWDGTHGQSATFSTRLGYYGDIYVPTAVLEALDLVEGDPVRVTIKSEVTHPQTDVGVTVETTTDDLGEEPVGVAE